jgi:hypothetical protein
MAVSANAALALLQVKKLFLNLGLAAGGFAAIVSNPVAAVANAAHCSSSTLNVLTPAAPTSMNTKMSWLAVRVDTLSIDLTSTWEQGEVTRTGGPRLIRVTSAPTRNDIDAKQQSIIC